jgi:putative phage-type endonuclease
MAAKLNNYDTKEAWLKARYDGIGGSDAGAIMGVNRFKTRDELLTEKTKPYEAKTLEETPRQKRGHDCEAPIKQMFWLDYESLKYSDRDRLGKYTILTNDEHPWLMGTPDCEIVYPQKDSPDTYGVLEIKTGRVYARDYDMLWKHKVPDSYYVQVLHYLLVNDEYKFAYLRGYLDHEDTSILMRVHTMQDYVFSRSSEVIAKDLDLLFMEELKFWNEVEKIRHDNIPAK